MEFLIDFEVTAPPRMSAEKTCDFSTVVPCAWPWSSQQLLFETYFRSLPTYPDEVVILQNIHDCARRGPREFRRDLRWLLDLVNASVPAASAVHLWEEAALNPAHQPMEWHAVTSDTCVQMMNGAIAEELAPYAAPSVWAAVAAVRGRLGGEQPAVVVPAGGGPVWRPTYGLFAPSQKVIEWNYDGVHFREPWYVQLARTLLHLACPEDALVP